jgi:hypothetical protein
MIRSIQSALVALACIVPALAAQAAPTATQVFNNNQIVSGSCSAVATVTGADPVFTVYFKNSTVTSAGYTVYLQGSPDGTNWSEIVIPSISVSGGSYGVGTYQMTTTVKATRVRVCVQSSTSFSATASAWIVN